MFYFDRKQNYWNQSIWLMEKRKDRNSVAVQALLKQVTFSLSSWLAETIMKSSAVAQEYL